MPLFQSSVLKKYLADLDPAKVQAAFAVFQQHFAGAAKQENIRNAKEEQFQEGFLRELFVDALGYTLNPSPDYNLTTEFKNQTDAKKADGAIMAAGGAIGVIELKGTNTTDFKKIEEQAFRYKNNQKGCRYVVTSNFERLRFYIDDATDYEEWDLFNLTTERFALLYLCLAKTNLLAHTPLAIKENSLAQEENVTKKLYADYRDFKRTLFADLRARNPEYDALLLYKKTQKLLDRFLFIFFAEDRGLLPPNSINEVLMQWQELRDKYDEPVSLYSRFRKYFGYMNTGHTGQKYEIFGYNGGLFAPDEALDNLKVGDTPLFNGAMALSRYDFVSEVDVNILGHIFEHSLNEIEEVQAELEGRAVDKGKTKRKKDGVFYTPKYITQYIVENTVGALCRQKQDELGITEENYAYFSIPHKNNKAEAAKRKELIDRLNAYQSWLGQITILDPACGSGAFLNQAFNFLIDEHTRLDRLRAAFFGDSLNIRDVDLAILEHNLYGVDLNEESVEIAQLALWLRTAKKGRKLSALSHNLRRGNSLIDDPAVAGDAAFDWQAAFPEVFAKGGFDVVVGNPPYGIFLSKEEETHFSANFPLTSYKTNLYVLFIERVFQIFENSIVSFIIPKSLLTNVYYAEIRKYLIINSEIHEFFTISEKVFEDAEVGGSLILTLKINKSKPNFNNIIQLVATRSFFDFPGKAIVSKVQQGDFLNYKNNEISIVSDDLSKIKQKIVALPPVSDFYVLKNGLNPGNIKHLLISDQKLSNAHKPIIWGKDISRYQINWSGDFVNYNEKIIEDISIDDIRSKEGMNAQSKIDFALRSTELFESSKIVIRKTGDSLIASYDESNNYYFDTLVHGIYQKESRFSLRLLLAILNSNPGTKFYRILHDIKGKVFAKISLDNLASFPFPKIEKNDLNSYALSLVEASTVSIEGKLKQLHSLTTRFLSLLTAKYPSLQPTRKLESWPELSFADFLKEVKKQKIAWSLKEESEWLEHFTGEQAAARALRQEIEKTDREIDRMVYTLYGLTEAEIALVEGKR